MVELAPGMCHCLEYIYPSSEATTAFCQGRQIESRAGGQQGYPLIRVCHALVQGILLESLGVAQVDPGTTAAAPTLSLPAAVDMTPMFVDDGFVACPSLKVQRALEQLQSFTSQLG